MRSNNRAIIKQNIQSVFNRKVLFSSNALPVKLTELDVARVNAFGPTDLMKKYSIRFETKSEPLLVWKSLTQEDKKLFFQMLNKLNDDNISLIKPFASCVKHFSRSDRDKFGYRLLNPKQEPDHVASVIVETGNGFWSLMSNHQEQLLSAVIGEELDSEKGFALRHSLMERGTGSDLKAVIAGVTRDSAFNLWRLPNAMQKEDGRHYLEGATGDDRSIDIATAMHAMGPDFWALPQDLIRQTFIKLGGSCRNDYLMEPHHMHQRDSTLAVMLIALKIPEQHNLPIENLRDCAKVALIIKANR